MIDLSKPCLGRPPHTNMPCERCHFGPCEESARLSAEIDRALAEHRTKAEKIEKPEPTKEQVQELVDAMWQLLDDMGRHGTSVCRYAKAIARIAYAPFYNVEPQDAPLYDETWMSLEEAQAIVADVERR